MIAHRTGIYYIPLNKINSHCYLLYDIYVHIFLPHNEHVPVA